MLIFALLTIWTMQWLNWHRLISYRANPYGSIEASSRAGQKTSQSRRCVFLTR